MSDGYRETKEKVRKYYEQTGSALTIDPFDIPEHPSEIELHVGWFFDRIRSIVTSENHVKKFGGPEEVLNLLHESAEILGLKITFIFFPTEGQWHILMNEPNDYLNLPSLASVFSKMWRFKPAPNRLYGGTKDPSELFGLKEKDDDDDLINMR